MLILFFGIKVVLAIISKKKEYSMKKIIFILALFFTHTILFAQTSVWKIQKNKETIYIGGTVHLLRAKDYPLPKEYDLAYKKSDVLYFETDLAALNQPSIQQSMLSKMMLKNGQKLKDLMSKETYEDLNTYALTRGVNLKDYDKFKPAMILLTLTVIELKKLGIDNDGVDKFYLNQALKDNKRMGALESVDAHINYIVTLGEGNEDNLVVQSLKDFKKTEKNFKRIISSWRLGSVGSLNKLFVYDMKKNFPKLYETLLVERNNNWMPVIESMFENNETEFVLVGVAHLVGKDGLLQQLRRKGYKTQKLK